MADLRASTELMAPVDLSGLCDGTRTDFPLGIETDEVKVMLDGDYLLGELGDDAGLSSDVR